MLKRKFSIEPTLTVKEQLETAICYLNSVSISMYGRALCSKGIHVVQVYSPKLERFFLASAGVPVVPGVRGIRSLTQDLIRSYPEACDK
jgi:hypothetical protein